MAPMIVSIVRPSVGFQGARRQSAYLEMRIAPRNDMGMPHEWRQPVVLSYPCQTCENTTAPLISTLMAS